MYDEQIDLFCKQLSFNFTKESGETIYDVK